jgi:hypothetical protein
MARILAQASLLIPVTLFAACGDVNGGSSEYDTNDTTTGGTAARDTPGTDGSRSAGAGGLVMSPTLAALSNPVTTPLTSTQCKGKIYAVAADADIDAVPWSSLAPGDCVNVARRATPYTHKFCLRTAATAAAPVVVHGVTDASGNRPQFDFGATGTTTAPDCAKVFKTSSPYSLEPMGGIVITGPQSPSSDPTYNPPKPSFLRVENLELQGATSARQFKSLTGASLTYSTLASGVHVQLGTDITVDNCVIHDNDYGVFTQAKDDTLAGATERLTVRNSRVYGNGRTNDYLAHNFYVQSTNPVIEGNYIGQTRQGSQGSSYKSRSSGEIFRFNYVVASARALDFVHAENSNQGVRIQPDYGVAYVYGNIVVNDANTPNGASIVPIHFGGDNLGEDNQATQSKTVEGTCSGCVPPGAYRSHLYFYSNLVWSNAPKGLVSVFEPALQSTKVHAWDNIFSLHGAAYYSWVQYAGTLELLGRNLAEVQSGAKVYDSTNDAYLALWGVAKGTNTLFVVKRDPNGALINAPAGFVSTTDFDLTTTSAAIGKATGVPASLSTSLPGYAKLASLRVNQEPRMQTNGTAARASAKDLGPEEH